MTRSLVRGLNAVHRGIEAEISYAVIQNLTVAATVMLSATGNGRMMFRQVFITITRYLVDSMNVYTKGLYVGDAPQTQLGFSADYRTLAGFRFAADIGILR